MEIIEPIKYVEENKSRFLDDLKNLIAIPSIAGLDQHGPDVRRCANLLIGVLKKAGLKNVGILNNDSKDEVPLVCADWNGAHGKPTILIYGHYDVVGIDNKLLWDSDPFEATIKDGNIYGRGASDDKGQLLTSIHAVETLLKTHGELPLNVKFLFEGEEESDSVSLGRILSEQTFVEKLSCDVVLASDTDWFTTEMPTICTGLRGICEFEINIRGPKFELHSGTYGGLVANPVNVLVEMLGNLRDNRQKIKIPGFYDAVVPLDNKDKEELSRLPFDEEECCKSIGVKSLRGEEGFTPLERKMCRPSLDIVGIWGGYAGVGPKTSIPTNAGAKVSMRLVSAQDPNAVAEAVEKYLREICPDSVSMEIEFFCKAHPYLVSGKEPVLQHAALAMKETFGNQTAFVRDGGSIPVVSLLNSKLRAPVIMCGIGWPTDKIHSDNEHLSLNQFYKGIEMYIRLFYELAGAFPKK